MSAAERASKASSVEQENERVVMRVVYYSASISNPFNPLCCGQTANEGVKKMDKFSDLGFGLIDGFSEEERK